MGTNKCREFENIHYENYRITYVTRGSGVTHSLQTQSFIKCVILAYFFSDSINENSTQQNIQPSIFTKLTKVDFR